MDTTITALSTYKLSTFSFCRLYSSDRFSIKLVPNNFSLSPPSQELSIHEKCLDYLTELLRKDQLDETISLDNLEKSLNFFHHLYNVHLASDEPGNQPLHCTELLTNHVRLMNAAADCIHTDLGRLKHMCPPPSGENNDIADLFKVSGSGLLEKIGRDFVGESNRHHLTNIEVGVI